MAKYVIDEATLKNLANAIRSATGETGSYTLSEMVAKISELKNQSGGPIIIANIVFEYECEMKIIVTEGTTWGEFMDGSGRAAVTYCALPGEYMFWDVSGSVDSWLYSSEYGIYSEGCPACDGDPDMYAPGYLHDADGNLVIESDTIVADMGYYIEMPDGIPSPFYIYDDEYQFETSMTWSEWLASEYNTATYTCDECGAVYKCIDEGDEDMVGFYSGGCDYCTERLPDVHLVYANSTDDIDDGNWLGHVDIGDTIDPAYIYGWDG